jgi:fatty acid desaturase
MTPPRRRARLMRNSVADLVPLSVAVLQVSGVVALAWSFDRLGPIAIMLSAMILLVLGDMAIQAEHYATHRPFFVPRFLNRGCQLLFSVIAGRPSSGYSIGHLHHHAFTISYTHMSLRDALGLTSPRTILASIARSYVNAFQLGTVWLLARGLGPRPGETQPAPRQHFDRYADYVDQMVSRVLAVGRARPQAARWLWAEIVAIAAFRIGLCIVSYRCFLLCILPMEVLAGLWAVYSEFCTHYGATGADASRNAASSYGRLFNLLWYNFGYHQEHHLRPSLHWTRLPSARGELPDERLRRVVPGALWFNPLLPLPSELDR